MSPTYRQAHRAGEIAGGLFVALIVGVPWAIGILELVRWVLR